MVYCIWHKSYNEFTCEKRYISKQITRISTKDSIAICLIETQQRTPLIGNIFYI